MTITYNGSGAVGNHSQIKSLIKENKTRSKTSRSSKALSQIGAKKITFPPKRDGQTDIRTDGHLLL